MCAKGHVSTQQLGEACSVQAAVQRGQMQRVCNAGIHEPAGCSWPWPNGLACNCRQRDEIHLDMPGNPFNANDHITYAGVLGPSPGTEVPKLVRRTQHDCKKQRAQLKSPANTVQLRTRCWHHHAQTVLALVNTRDLETPAPP